MSDAFIEVDVEPGPAHEDGVSLRFKRTAGGVTRAVPETEALLIAVAERGGNLGSTVARLLVLLDQEGPEALRAAIVEVMASRTPHVGAVRQVLEGARRARGTLPKVAKASTCPRRNIGIAASG